MENMVSLMSWNELRQDEKQENSVSRLKTLLIIKGVLNKCYQYWLLIKKYKSNLNNTIRQSSREIDFFFLQYILTEIFYFDILF